MTSATEPLPRRVTGGKLGWFASITVVAAASGWASTSDARLEEPAHHASPASVEAIEGSEFARVTLTQEGAERIGLEVVQVGEVPPGEGVGAVPEAALVWGADGTTWVYASDGEPLAFVRHVVVVAGSSGGTAILSRGPAPGTSVAGVGSAELYGTEFEVGH